jgi:membrane-bound metal-dependent hydrolase YbcI (DUF457 family)
VASPIGHALVGMTLARRMGMTSPAGMAAGVVAAGLPDFDVFAGIALHRDPWKLHVRGAGTHTLGFALASGMLAGFGGLIGAGSAEGERDLIADVFAGAVLVGSHILLDVMPLPYLKLRKGMPARQKIRRSAVNWTLDALVYGFVAARLWNAGSPTVPAEAT